MDFPFAITYSIINNILTIVFDFSKLLDSDSMKEYEALKTDYFNGGGFYVNGDFHQIRFSDYRKQQTFVIDMTKNSDYDEAVTGIELVFSGEKCASYWSGNSNEYPVTLPTKIGYQWAIDYHRDMIQHEEYQLECLYIRSRRLYGKRITEAVTRHEKGHKRVIEGHNNTIAVWQANMDKLTTTGVTLYKR